MTWRTIFSKPTPPSSDLWFGEGEGRRPLRVIRHAQARRMKLAIDARDGSVRLTIPKRAPLGPALHWAESKRGWVEAQLARRPQGEGIRPGMTVPFEGQELILDWSASHPRTPRVAGDRLMIGGPVESLDTRLERWLRAEAKQRFEAETRALAVHIDRNVARVSVGDPASRWGSCSSSGGIRYSWRLILAPPFVRHMIVAHEVAHLVHMNHSPAFHALALRLSGEDPKPANRWLRANSARLHGFGKTSS